MRTAIAKTTMGMSYYSSAGLGRSLEWLLLFMFLGGGGGFYSSSSSPSCFLVTGFSPVPMPTTAWQKNRYSTRQTSLEFNARMGGNLNNDNNSRQDTNDVDNDKGKKIVPQPSTAKNEDTRAIMAEIENDNIDSDDEKEYQQKLAEARAAIAEAKKARDKYYLKKQQQNQGSFRSQLQERFSDNDNDNSANSLRSTQSLLSDKNDMIPTTIRSRIEYTDAGTMKVNIPPRGTTTNSVFAGAFSAAWFSAIVPATISSGGAGLLFMLPFWAAGGIVAKQAVVDPYLSFQLSIGQYAWSLQRTYAGKTITSKSAEGATDRLQGALVELAMVVNEVPLYELRLYSSINGDDMNSSKGSGDGMTALGLGLPLEELEYLANEINNHIVDIKNFPDDLQLLDKD